MPEWLENLLYLASKNTMNLGRGSGNISDKEEPKYKFSRFGEEYQHKHRDEEPPESTAQATYLLPRSLQRKKFLEHGYLEGTPGDYGLVRKAVGNNNFPVFQTAPDQASRDQLVPIGNDIDSFKHTIPEGTELQHAGHYPSAFYIDQDFKVYRKDWDLNDYGNSTGRAGTKYHGIKQLQANLIDKIGSPVVVTTGFQPAITGRQTLQSNDSNKQYTLYDLYEDKNPMAIKFIQDRGLVPYYEEVPLENPYGGGPVLDYQDNPIMREKLTMFTLPEVIVNGKTKKK